MQIIQTIFIASENNNGAKRTRTAGPLHAMQVLYQLSYGPIPITTVTSRVYKEYFLTVLLSIVLYKVLYFKLEKLKSIDELPGSI